jgi:hypothetical protein
LTSVGSGAGLPRHQIYRRPFRVWQAPIFESGFEPRQPLGVRQSAQALGIAEAAGQIPDAIRGFARRLFRLFVVLFLALFAFLVPRPSPFFAAFLHRLPWRRASPWAFPASPRPASSSPSSLPRRQSSFALPKPASAGRRGGRSAARVTAFSPLWALRRPAPGCFRQPLPHPPQCLENSASPFFIAAHFVFSVFGMGH